MAIIPGVATSIDDTDAASYTSSVTPVPIQSIPSNTSSPSSQPMKDLFAAPTTPFPFKTHTIVTVVRPETEQLQTPHAHAHTLFDTEPDPISDPSTVLSDTVMEIKKTRAIQAAVETAMAIPVESSESAPDQLEPISHVHCTSSPEVVVHMESTPVVSTPAPATPVVNAPPLVAADEDTIGKVMTGDEHISFKRVGGDNSYASSHNRVKFCAPSCRALANYIENVITKHNAPATIVSIDGVMAANGRNVCLWEEGGSTADVGGALLITGPDGMPLPPVTVFSKPSIFNGRHALVNVGVGCYVLLGGRSMDDNRIAIYQITSITKATPSDATNLAPTFTCSLVATYPNDEDNVTNLVDSPNAVKWSIDSLAVSVMLGRLEEQYATTPCYVLDYRQCKFNASLRDDFNSCLQDAEFMGKVIDFGSLEKAYHYANRVLGGVVEKLSTSSKFKTSHVLLYVYVVYNDSARTDEMITVYLVATLYDTVSKTSNHPGGRLFYGKVHLGPKDQFYYPDQFDKDKVTFAAAESNLNTYSYNGRSMIVLRRMTSSSSF